jgi:hypothetical protein
MKKNIMIISIALIGLILVFSGNSWAARNGSGPYQKWDKPSNPAHKPNHGRNLAPGIQNDRPKPQPIPRFHRPYPPRAPYRLAPQYRHWRQRPFYRPFGHRHHAGVNEINNYYSRVERYYTPEDEFGASATISDTGFSVSVGVRETN